MTDDVARGTIATFVEHTDIGPEVHIGVVERCEEGASEFGNDLWYIRGIYHSRDDDLFEVDATDCCVIDAERLQQLKLMGGRL